MCENEHLLNLKEISSSVNERDLKIYENVAHSICIKKAEEKLKSETERMKNEILSKKQDIEMMKTLMQKADEEIVIQKETLRLSEHSLNLHHDLENCLKDEIANSRQKYTTTLEMYEKEYHDQKHLYEEKSKSYQALKTLQITLKKIQVENKIIDMKIRTAQQSYQQYNQIQKKISQTNIVKFAEFYLIYHRNEALKREIASKKREEQELLKEHLQLQQDLKKRKTACEIEEKAAKEEKQDDKIRKFLEEELKPCSLTKIVSRAPSFNQEQTKVKILEVKTLRPSQKVVKGDELRKKMEGIMQNARLEAKTSFHLTPLSLSQKSETEMKPSILKNDNAMTSKFFEKKKSVTFEKKPFQLFPEENPFKDHTKMETSGTDESVGSSKVTFTGDTENTMNERNETSFDLLEQSFAERSFVNPPEEPTFSFFNSQSKQNPFNFF